MNTALKKNDVVTLRTTELLQNGNALSKTEDGFVVFVVGAAANETVSALIIKVTKNYAVAKTLEILQPSVDRNEDGCPFSHKCGGCVFQHITYESECTYKQNAINDAFSRIGKLDLCLSEFIPSPSEKYYRNKAIYPIGIDSNGNITTGFYARMSHRIVEHEECLIGNPRFIPIRNSVVAFLQKNGVSVYDENTEKGLVRSIYLRAGEDNNQTALSLILNGKTLVSEKLESEFVSFINENHPEVSTILINTNTKASNAVLGKEWRTIFGDGYIYDTLCEKRFRITPASFWQVNNRGACKLYSKAKEYANLKKGEMLLDLYCGTGSVGICIAGTDNKLFGVEITPQAVKDATYNAEINGIDAQFICADAQNALDDERVKNLKPDVITVDPPRKGCDGTVEKIASFGAKRIVYISCDPATLARDLASFEQCGYKVQKACGVDMFARTGHVETVVLLAQTKFA